ncbi:MAG: cyclopropane-fatty-acyl-phospholipid synthase family protein [Ketobacteraceae bacterium]|nr:cyclopropane-fatty-acyl-phospholipid synthase family protein [Ketobacteraceae bacterium]
MSQLENISHGSLIIEDPLEKHHFVGPEPGPVGKIRIKDMEAYKDIALGGSIGAAEAYMTSDWSTDNLTDVIRLMTLNLDVLESMEGGLAKLFMPLLRFTHWLNRNTAKGAQRNIAAHYDLGNEFFEMFLDPTMMYSSGIFPDESAGMREASLNKMRIICEKLELKPTDHVVEIGTGWGSMAIYMAEHYGCDVTTTTISKEQHHYAAERIREKGLEHKITLLLEDYRDLPALSGARKFDKLVSVEMIEAVGHQFYHSYFSTIDHLLKPNGLALIQAITIEDHRYELARRRVDFIQKYVFPGSCIPSIAAISDAVRDASKLRLIHQSDFAGHYARTLSKWHEKLNKNWESIAALGYDETFLRMWQFYLSYCEGGFAERAIGVSHLLYAKPMNRTTARL